MLKKNKSSNKIVWLYILGAVILAIIASAVILNNATHSKNTVDNKLSENIVTGNTIGDLAPDFTLATVDGKTMSLYDYRGKNIILNFWATWCGPCTYEVPFIKQIDETWSKAGVVVIAVNVQDDVERARYYASKSELNFIIPVDPRGSVAGKFNVKGLPTSFFIDSEGVIKSIKVGPFTTVEEIEQRMAHFK